MYDTCNVKTAMCNVGLYMKTKLSLFYLIFNNVSKWASNSMSC